MADVIPGIASNAALAAEAAAGAKADRKAAKKASRPKKVKPTPTKAIAPKKPAKKKGR
jgi:hypothetical protein